MKRCEGILRKSDKWLDSILPGMTALKDLIADPLLIQCRGNGQDKLKLITEVAYGLNHCREVEAHFLPATPRKQRDPSLACVEAVADCELLSWNFWRG